MLNRVFHYGRERRAKEAAQAAECDLILNAIEVLRRQRAVAVAKFGIRDPHIAEIDAERNALYAQASQCCESWA